MSHQPDFGEFLHNPYRFDFLNEKQQAAVTVFKRKSRFVEGYDPEGHLRQVLTKFFGNRYILHLHGMNHHYLLLKAYVELNNLIGLILFGADPDNVKGYQPINKYTTPSGSEIELTMTNLCRFLLNDHFGYRESQGQVDTLCEETPEFETYYEPEQAED